MKRISESEAIEVGLNVVSIQNDEDAVKVDIENVMMSCGFELGTEEADAALKKAMANWKRKLAPMIPILPGSEKAIQNPGCLEWNYENEQAVQPGKRYKASTSTETKDDKFKIDIKAIVTGNTLRAAEIKSAAKSIDAAMKEAGECAAVTTNKSNNNKENTTMAKSREEKRMNWDKVAANNSNNNNMEDSTMNIKVADIENKGVAVETKEVINDALAALKGLATDLGVTDTDVKAAAKSAVKATIADDSVVMGGKASTTPGIKKLRVGAGKAANIKTRNRFWYRDYEGIDLSKGDLVEYENAGNLRYIVTMDEPMYCVSRILIFAPNGNNANAICDVMVELENGLLLKGFKVWNSKEADGSISLLGPRYSYTKESEVKYGSHIEFRDKDGKMTAPGFVAVILACVDDLLTDVNEAGDADDDEE